MGCQCNVSVPLSRGSSNIIKVSIKGVLIKPADCISPQISVQKDLSVQASILTK